jgi:hypothetical protein
MNVFRCVGLLVVLLLSACDAQQDAAPKPKVAAEAGSQAQPAAPAAVAVKPGPAKAPVHELSPNVPVVPVIAKGERAASPAVSESRQPKPSAAKAEKPTSGSKRDAATRKSVAESKKTLKDTSLDNAKLDLSLPPELAKELKPVATVTPKPRKPLLPPMFGDKEESTDGGPFQLNGRLLSNEMQLQMRNDNRRDVEGAALDFKFKQ